MITSVFSGGYSHPFAQTGAALKTIAEDCGCIVDIQDAIPDPLDLSGVDLAIVNGLWWSMTQHEKYAADRAQWAFTLSDSQMDAIERHVVEDGGLLYAVHTSVICFDTQPRWKALLGGGWTWGASHHPPMGPFQVRPTREGVEAGLADFQITDECYHHLNLSGDCKVWMTGETSETDEGCQPLAWVRRAGKGHVAVNALGHDARSINTAGNRALIETQLRWLAGDKLAKEQPHVAH